MYKKKDLVMCQLDDIKVIYEFVGYQGGEPLVSRQESNGLGKGLITSFDMPMWKNLIFSTH